MGPAGPPGPGAGGASGAVVPVELRSNVGQGTVLLYNQRGATVEQDCNTFFSFGARVRSTVENSVAEAVFSPAYGTAADVNNGSVEDSDQTTGPFTSTDVDMDTNNPIFLAPQAPGLNTFFAGHFSFSGGGGLNSVVTGVYVGSSQFATAQGDCVFAGILNQDS